MSVVPLQVFVSLVLVAGSILLLAYSIRHADHEHADRLALLPIDDEPLPAPPEQAPTAPASAPAQG